MFGILCNSNSTLMMVKSVTQKKESVKSLVNSGVAVALSKYSHVQVGTTHCVRVT